MKKLIPLIIVAILIFNTTNVSASTNIPLQNTTITDIEYISEDYYIVTTIKDITPKNNVSAYSTAKSITREKTISGKSGSGTTLWTLTVSATFSYNGKTATCTSWSGKATTPSADWTYSNFNCTRRNNTATSNAIFKFKDHNTYTNLNKSVTIKCSPTGVVS